MLSAVLALTIAAAQAGACNPSASEGVLGAVAAVVDATRAVHDPALDVRIVEARELRYADGADAALDRPAFVRAGSGLALVDGTLWIAQDDANFLGVVDLAGGGLVSAVPLPRGAGGRRLFDDGRANKKGKMDLEALTRLPDGRLLALGSGSSSGRYSVVLVERDRSVRVVDATAFYRSLEARPDFTGPELNLEGAVAFEREGETWLRLFQRGNGDRTRREPVDATAEVPLADVLAGRATTLRDVRIWDLGAQDGVKLTFSDAAPAPDGSLAFLASAEDSSNTIADGTLHGVVIGRLDARGGRYGRVLEADGSPSRRKLEGLAWDAARGRWLAVEDPDDATVPSRLVVLGAPSPLR